MLKEWNQLKVQYGHLYRERHNLDNTLSYQYVLPFKCKRQAMFNLHNQVGHPGAERSLSLLQERFFLAWYVQRHE